MTDFRRVTDDSDEFRCRNCVSALLMWNLREERLVLVYLKAIMKSISWQIDDIAVTMKKLQDDIVTNHSTGISANTAIDTLKNNYQTVMERLSAMENDLSTIDKDVRRSCDNVENKITVRLASMEETIANDRKQSQQLSMAQSNLSGTVSSLSGTVQLLQERNEVIQRALTECKSNVAKLDTTVGQNHKDINALQNQLSKIQMSSQNDTSGIKELQKQVARVNDRIDNIHQQRASYVPAPLPTKPMMTLEDTDDESVTIGRSSAREVSATKTYAASTQDTDFNHSDGEDAHTFKLTPSVALRSDNYDENVESRENDGMESDNSAVEENDDDLEDTKLSLGKSRKKAGSGALTVRGVMKKSDEAVRGAIGNKSVLNDDIFPKSRVRSARDTSSVDEGDDSDIESIEQIETIDKEEASSPAQSPKKPSAVVIAMSRASDDSSDDDEPVRGNDDINTSGVQSFDNDMLSSAESTPVKPAVAVASKPKSDFMSNLDNSFDESGEFSPLVPTRPAESSSPAKNKDRSPLQRRRSSDSSEHGTPQSTFSPSGKPDPSFEVDENNAEDDDELPRYRPEIAAALAAIDSDKDHTDDDDDVIAHTITQDESHAVSSIDKIKSFSLVSSDDGGMENQSHTFDSLALSDDSSTDSTVKKKSVSTPGKLPKSSSNKFSHELEDVVTGYWKNKVGSDEEDDRPNPLSNSSSPATSPIRSTIAAKTAREQDITPKNSSAGIQKKYPDESDGGDSDWDQSDTSPEKAATAAMKKPATTPIKSSQANDSEDDSLDDEDEKLMSGTKTAATVLKEGPVADPYAGLSMR